MTDSPKQVIRQTLEAFSNTAFGPSSLQVRDALAALDKLVQPNNRADVILVARCAEHGLHGQRDTCFVCGGAVEQVPLVDTHSPLSGGSVSRVTSAVTSRTPATASAELASRPEYFQPPLFQPDSEWDGTIPVPYNVVPY